MINIAVILKDYPKGTKLYSSICGECYFNGVIQNNIYVTTKKNNIVISFDKYGIYNTNYGGKECLLFPSEKNRNWNNFHASFNAGIY